MKTSIHGFVKGDKVSYVLAELQDDHKWHDITCESVIKTIDDKKINYIDPQKGVIACNMVFLEDGNITYDHLLTRVVDDA